KRKIFLFLCILTCAAFVTACGKDDTADKSDAVVQGSESDESTVIENKEDDTEEVTDETTAVPEDEVINPDAEDEPGDEELESDDDDNVSIGDASENEEADEDDSTTDVQNNVSENPSEEFSASGTFNGFVDSSSVEITMSDGTYQNFFVYDEDVLARLQEIDENGSGTNIQFTYRGIEGQVNPEIISVQ
ncbi:MAG: hypothetical protein Q4B70_07215, partial [Lachnospiraceae bacterium]|nr:hypothetical protein [Lachnospiraceae bacterium]